MSEQKENSVKVTREMLIGARAKPRVETIDASEFGEGVTLNVRGLTGPEWAKVRLDLDGNKDDLVERVKTFIASVVDDSGAQIFSDRDDRNVRDFPVSILNRVYHRALVLNGLITEKN